MQNGLVPHPCVVDKNSRGISLEQEIPAPHQASQSRVPFPGKISLHNFWLPKPAGIESVEETDGVTSRSSQRTHVTEQQVGFCCPPPPSEQNSRGKGLVIKEISLYPKAT